MKNKKKILKLDVNVSKKTALIRAESHKFPSSYSVCFLQKRYSNPLPRYSKESVNTSGANTKTCWKKKITRNA